MQYTFLYVVLIKYSINKTMQQFQHTFFHQASASVVFMKISVAFSDGLMRKIHVLYQWLVSDVSVNYENAEIRMNTF
jgi:hypothetical protein